MPRILIADDDTELTALLQDYLGGQGFACDAVHDGVAAQAQAAQYDALVLDVMMPRQDGFAALSGIRRSSTVPVIMLTARGEDIDRILGLEMGADDYLPKPFNPRELAARLKAVLRRRPDPGSSDAETLRVGDLSLLPGRREARLDGQPLELTGTEFEVLAVLAESAGMVVERDALSRQALGRRWLPSDRSLDMHVSNLRRKLGPERLKTLRGRGYQLVK